MSRWSGAVGGKNWARKAWEAAVKGEREEEEDDDMLVAAEEALCGLCCGVVCEGVEERDDATRNLKILQR